MDVLTLRISMLECFVVQEWLFEKSRDQRREVSKFVCRFHMSQIQPICILVQTLALCSLKLACARFKKSAALLLVDKISGRIVGRILGRIQIPNTVGPHNGLEPILKYLSYFYTSKVASIFCCDISFMPTVCLIILYPPIKRYIVNWLQEKQVCESHDDATPLSFWLQVTEDFF